MNIDINYNNLEIHILYDTNSYLKVKSIINNNHMINLISHIIINLNTASRFQKQNDILFSINEKYSKIGSDIFKEFYVTILMRNKKTATYTSLMLMLVVSKIADDTDSIINFYNFFKIHCMTN